MTYRHTQVGTLTIAVFLLGSVLAFAGGAFTDWHPATLVFAGVMVAILVLFPGLTVTVSRDAIRCRFGVGPIARSIPVARVREARRVRNCWWYGWGIRRVPGAWMFNVSGLDAVELTLTGGKRFRIGTDDPDGLVRAIHAARESART